MKAVLHHCDLVQHDRVYVDGVYYAMAYKDMPSHPIFLVRHASERVKRAIAKRIIRRDGNREIKFFGPPPKIPQRLRRLV